MKCLNSFNEYYFNQFSRLVSQCRERNNTNLINNYRRVCSSIQKYPLPILSIQQALTMDGIGEAISRTFDKFIRDYKKKIQEESINYIELAFNINDNRSKKGKKFKAESESGTDTHKNFIKKKPLKNIESYSANWTAALSLYFIYMQEKCLIIDLEEAQQMGQTLMEELQRHNIKIQKCELKNFKDLKDHGMVDQIEIKTNDTKIKINDFLIKLAQLELKKNKIEIEIDEEGTLSFQITLISNNLPFEKPNELTQESSKNKINYNNDLKNILSQKNYNLTENDLIDSKTKQNSVDFTGLNKIYSNKDSKKNSNLDYFVSKTKNNLNNINISDSFNPKNETILIENREFRSGENNTQSKINSLKENLIGAKDENISKIKIKNNAGLNLDKNVNDSNNKSQELINNLNYIYEQCNIDYNDFDLNTDFSRNEKINSQEFYTDDFQSITKSYSNINSKYNYLFKSNTNNLNCIIENTESKNNCTHSNIEVPNCDTNIDESFIKMKNYGRFNELIESSKKNSTVVDLSTLKKKKNKKAINKLHDSDSEDCINMENSDKINYGPQNHKTKMYEDTKFKSENLINLNGSSDLILCSNKEEKPINNNIRMQIEMQDNRESINDNCMEDNIQMLEKTAEENFRKYKRFLKSINSSNNSFNNRNSNNICEEEDFEIFSLNIKLLIDNREKGPKGEKLSDEIRCIYPELICEERVLSVGDFLWIYCDPHTETEYILDYIIERKTLGDFASSIRDGRYVEQKHRLKNTKINNIFYLFEGNTFNSAYNCISKNAVFTGILNTFNIHDIGIIKTSTFEDSLDYLANLDKFIKHYYFTNRENLDLFTMITFQDFMLKNAKTKNLSEENIFLKQLRCFDDCGAKSVEILKKTFKSPIEFYRLLKKIDSEEKKANLIDCMIYLAENKMDFNDNIILDLLEPKNFKKIKKELKSIKKIRKNTNNSIISFYS